MRFINHTLRFNFANNSSIISRKRRYYTVRKFFMYSTNILNGVLLLRDYCIISQPRSIGTLDYRHRLVGNYVHKRNFSSGCRLEAQIGIPNALANYI